MQYAYNTHEYTISEPIQNDTHKYSTIHVLCSNTVKYSQIRVSIENPTTFDRKPHLSPAIVELNKSGIALADSIRAAGLMLR